MKENNTYYITTPIYYASGKPHIGHSYTTVAADATARFKRLQGYDVMFLTGMDEHGQKVENKAAEEGVTPQQYVDAVCDDFKSLWSLLNISYDRFIRTTDDYHVKTVQKIFKALYDKGYIYKGGYNGLYCTPCESFWTPTQAVDGKCPDCGRDCVEAVEEAYFFKLSAFADRLVKLYEDNPEFCMPKSRQNEMINNFIKPGLEDLCVSRTAFKWGVPVEFDPKHVVYVWVDALSNYITAMGYGSDNEADYVKYWPADCHLVGKEIFRFHSIIWPAMLMALDLPLPKKIYGHGWMLFDNDKMSKSKGNVIDPLTLTDRYGVDALRYFILREMPAGNDFSFTNRGLITRINTDLANDLGNLVSRTTAMCAKYFGGKLPAERYAQDIDKEVEELCLKTVFEFTALMDKFDYANALASLWNIVGRANKYIDETAPWVLGKSEEEKPRLASVLYTLCEALRFVTVLVEPVMPQTAAAIRERLCLTEENSTYTSLGAWGGLPAEAETKTGDPLFPRIDVEKEIEYLEQVKAASAAKAAKAAAKAEEPKKEEKKESGCLCNAQATIEDFLKLRIIAAKVKDCKKIEGSDKLLVFTLDDGTGADRQVVSGIAKFYDPQTLIGKTVAVIANLKPVKLKGVQSNGMILSADLGESVKLVELDGVEPGSVIR